MDSAIKLEDYKEISEGKAKILFPKTEEVFYNPVQEYNRDLSIAVISAFQEIYHTARSDDSKYNSSAIEKPIKILEALSATGLRSIRYSKEIPNIGKIVANDYDSRAVEAIRRNILYNGIDERLIEARFSDASFLMHQARATNDLYDIVDIDPYGSAAPFLDSAVNALNDGGLLCITCTDMAVLCGSNSDACYAKYRCMPVHAKHCHEMALRIVLASVEAHANRYKKYIEPLLSCSIDFYVRIFVRIHHSASEVKRSASKHSYIFQCCSCESFHFQPVGKRIETDTKRKYSPAVGPSVGQECCSCGGSYHVGGPLWTDPIHDPHFVQKIIENVRTKPDSFKTSSRILGMLSVVAEELPDAPLYYTLDGLTASVHCQSPPLMSFVSALLHQGFKASLSHANSNAIKTNAPVRAIWDVIRCWTKLHPVAERHLSGRSPAASILSKEPLFEANFQIHPNANPQSRKMKLVRFQQNPEENWGPRARATSSKRKKVDSKPEVQDNIGLQLNAP